MPLQLTPEEKQKLLEYTKRQGLPPHKDSLKLQAGNSEEPADLISWCVEDIVEKLERVEYYKNKSEMEKVNFKSVLYSDFLSGIANNLTRDLLDMSKNSNNYYGLNALLETDNPKEFFGNLATIVSFVPELAENFIEYTVAIYLGLCTKFYVLVDFQILSLSKTLA